ncbi:hypothetical protein LCGC14_1101650 [marine sediment metagenome]|uniref:Uncharacterized protein n=1 Tax=marine sediment metagenome TaxID=412755 RepID=A0A0F9QFH0_9ZZZZ
MTKQLVEAVEQYDEDTGNLSDDLREHGLEDLQNKYGLDLNEAGMLWLVIREDTDPLYCAYGIKEENSKAFLENVQESIHQSFEGHWSDYDRIVIRSYLADIALATHLTVDPDLRVPTW